MPDTDAGRGGTAVPSENAPSLPFVGTVWRAVLAGSDPLRIGAAPEGRFHRAGQIAVYTSLTVQGCGVAIKRYLGDGQARVLFPLTIDAKRVADLRGQPEVSAVWQDIRAAGAPSPTWAFSETARASGAQGMLYSSRSRPDLTHLVIFDLSVIRMAGRPQAMQS